LCNTKVKDGKSKNECCLHNAEGFPQGPGMAFIGNLLSSTKTSEVTESEIIWNYSA